jgi:hypothetical protein
LQMRVASHAERMVARNSLVRPDCVENAPRTLANSRVQKPKNFLVLVPPSYQVRSWIPV